MKVNTIATILFLNIFFCIAMFFLTGATQPTAILALPWFIQSGVLICIYGWTCYLKEQETLFKDTIATFLKQENDNAGASVERARPYKQPQMSQVQTKSR